MIRVIDRYLLRELLVPFALGTGLFTFFLIIDRIYSLTDLVITKGVPFYLVVQLLVYMLPSFLAHTLPMALLVAILLGGGRLAGDLEIVAFKAAGIGAGRLLRPVLLAAAGVALATASMTLVVNPASNAMFQHQLFKILQTRAASGLRERVFNSSFGDMVIYIEEMSPSRVALRSLLVSDERDPKLTRIITAREGRLLTDEETHRITLRLIDGGINESDVAPSPPVNPATRPPGSELPPPPTGGAATADRYRYTAFGIYDMNLTVESPFKGAPRIEKPEKNFSMRQLDRAISDARARGEPAEPYLVEYHKRFALGFAAIVFALVGFPLAARSHRGGRSLALVGSLAILVAYYLLLTSLEGLALSRRLPAWLAIWLPNLLFGGLGGGLMGMEVSGLAAPSLGWLWNLREALGERVQRVSGPVRGDFGLRESRDSTHLIDRYLVRSYLTFFAISLGVASALFVIVDLLQTLDRYLRVKPPLVYILQHFLYRLPVAVYDGLPVVTLVATIFLFLTVSRYHELTALKAAGVSLYRASLPIVVLAVLTSIGAGLFQELLVPTLNERGDELDRVKIRGQLPRHLQIQTRIWLRSSDSRFFRVELLDPVTQDMHGVTILEIDKDFRLVNRLDAAIAHWTSGGWVFGDGAFREIDASGRILTVPFARTAFELPETIQEFTEAQKPVNAMSFLELRAYIRRLHESGHQVKKYLVELYGKLSFPLAHLVMVLVAIPFALQSPGGGRMVGIGIAIGILAGYLVVHYSAIAFARADLLPPLLAAWTANIVFVGLGVALLLRART